MSIGARSPWPPETPNRQSAVVNPCNRQSAIGSRQCLAPGGLAADVDGAETRLAPAHDEDAEALLQTGFDVGFRRGVAARDVEFLACGEHLLDGRFPAGGVEVSLPVRACRREHA